MAIGNQVNNQIVDDQQPLTSAIPQDPSTQTDVIADENQQQGPISVGSPESAPMSPTVPESNNTSPEFGYEALKRIEQTPESISDAERKETAPQQRQQPKQQTKPVQKPQPIPQPKQQGPKVFGYNIPPALLNNFQAISRSRSKGSPKDSSTWVVMLLDRILRKQKGL